MFIFFVLIVAKCNVNYVDASKSEINFSLIVAKCNVNYDINLKNLTFKDVLIVAKCNVNLFL